MPVGWSVPPAASPLSARDLLAGISGAARERHAANRFTQSLRDHFGLPGVFLVSSGTAALSLSLRALHEAHPDKNLVCVPAFTCFSVAAAVRAAGLRIVLGDINPCTLDFDYRDLSRCLAEHTENLLAVIATHLYGVPARISRIRSIAGETPVLEDAAQAMGACFDNGWAGTLGDIGIFSLGRGKALTAFEGGIIITGNCRYADSLRKLVDALPSYNAKEKAILFAQTVAMQALLNPRRFWLPQILPFLHLGETRYKPRVYMRKMSGLQAGLMRRWRDNTRTLHRLRKAIAAEWNRQIPLAITDGETLQQTDFGALIRYPVFLRDSSRRDQLVSLAHKEGLGLSSGYPHTLATLPVIESHERSKQYPGAHICARHLATLPNHPYVTGETVASVHRLINRCGGVDTLN